MINFQCSFFEELFLVLVFLFLLKTVCTLKVFLIKFVIKEGHVAEAPVSRSESFSIVTH